MGKEADFDINTSDSSKELLEKLRYALQHDGDFPVSARIVNEIRTLASNPNTTIEKITDVILREPSLGTRVLHLVNSAYYQRPQPIMTITSAIMQLGMKALSDLCAGLVIMQRFIPAARRGEIFAENLKKSIIISLLTTALASDTEEEGGKECGYLAGTFYNLGYLLLAYYFPQVYEAAYSRAKARGHDVTQSLTEILGVGPKELSLAIVDALDIPSFYTKLIVEVHTLPSQRTSKGSTLRLVRALATSDKLASNIVRGTGEFELKLSTAELAESEGSGFSLAELNSVICELPNQFSEHCKMLELSFLTLPDYLSAFCARKKTAAPDKTPKTQSLNASFLNYTKEIRQQIAAKEPLSSIVTSVMESLAFGLKFTRVLLLLEDKGLGQLAGRMALGNKINFDPKKVFRYVEKEDIESNPDAAAFLVGCPQIFGDPIFPDGWPFAAIPIGGSRNPAIGVIYADIVTNPDENEQPLDDSVQASLSVLADLLDEALTGGGL